MEISDKIAMVHKYVEAFDKADIDIIREIFSDDARVEDPVGTDIHDGLEAVCAFYEGALLSLIHISEPTRPSKSSRMPSSA